MAAFEGNAFCETKLIWKRAHARRANCRPERFRYESDWEITMKIKSAPWWLWLIPIAFLLLATAQMSLNYYTATRFIVFCAAAFIAFVSWSDGLMGRLGSVALAMV